jgi:hypothetical protein
MAEQRLLDGGTPIGTVIPLQGETSGIRAAGITFPRGGGILSLGAARRPRPGTFPFYPEMLLKMDMNAGHIDVRHVDARDVYVWHVEVRDAVVADVADVAEDVERCAVDGSRAGLGIRWTRDEGGENRRCGGESGRENRCEIGSPNPHGSHPFRRAELDQRKSNSTSGAWVYWQRVLRSTKG